MAALLALAGCAGTGTPPQPGNSASTSSTSDGTSAGAVISAEQAKAIAVQAVGSGQAGEVEADDENNVPVWKVTVVSADGVRHRVSVDQRTGAVLVTEIDK